MTSLSWRLTVGFALAVTITVMAALFTGRWLLAREMVDGLQMLHAAEFNEVLQQLGGAPGRLAEDDLIRRMTAHSAADENLFFFQVHEHSGRVLFRSPTLGEAILPDLSAGGDHWTMEVPPHGRIYISEFTRDGMHFEIGSRLRPTERLLAKYLRVSFGLTGLVALASLGLGYGISRVALRPLRAIKTTAQRIGAENLGERIPVPPGRDEVADLTRLLNAMFDRLETAFRQVRQFSADASHELKTPLALVRLNAERLRGELAADPARAALVDNLLDEADAMQRVIDGLLFLAKAESGTLQLQRARQDTATFIAGVAEDVSPLTEDRGLKLRVTRNEAGEAAFDRGLMRQLLFNVLSNAVTASPPGGTITLDSRIEGGRWCLDVTDEGPGLPAGELERVFERFVQLPRPGATAGGGHGLGLAICRGIARRHGGEVRARNRPDRPGLVLVIELPCDG